MIRDMYDQKKAGTYLGVCGTMMAIGMLAGPVLGGFIMDAFSWRIVCHVIWPILLVGGLMVFFGVKATKEEAADMASAAGRFDVAGTIAVVVFLSALISGLSLGTSFVPVRQHGQQCPVRRGACGLDRARPGHSQKAGETPSSPRRRSRTATP